MNIARVLINFCHANKCSLFTPEEKKRILDAEENIKRIRSHYDKFGPRVARDKVQSAKADYLKDPSEANRKSLDGLQLNWRQVAMDHSSQRRVIGLALVKEATQAAELVPGILIRTAGALDHELAKIVAEDKARYAAAEVPYEGSRIVLAFREHISRMLKQADGIQSFHFSWDAPLSAMAEFSWYPQLLNIEGPVWEMGEWATLHPIKPKNRMGIELPDCRPVITKRAPNANAANAPFAQPLIARAVG